MMDYKTFEAIVRKTVADYTNRDGQKVYTTDVVAEEQEFAESKSSEENGQQAAQGQQEAKDTGFMDIPDGAQNDLPFA